MIYEKDLYNTIKKYTKNKVIKEEQVEKIYKKIKRYLILEKEKSKQ